MSQPAGHKIWDPVHYLKYADQRLRPALDLLARVPLDRAERITDLGCGPGTVAPHLAQAFPDAEITGVDSSGVMLDAARAAYGASATWTQADAATWQPDTPQDLIYANAALQWLDDHLTLFPRLFGFLKPGGVLAVQMPNQYNNPSHVLMREVAENGPWADTLAPLLRPAPVARPEDYVAWLSPKAATVDVWQTEYCQVMTGEDPVLDWIGSTALKPLCEALALANDQRTAFLETLGNALRNAYPRHPDGTTLFPFRRLFIVAVKA